MPIANVNGIQVRCTASGKGPWVTLTATPGGGFPVHPGVARYLADAGVAK